MRGMFEEEEEVDLGEFVGFQDEWKMGSYHPCRKREFSRKPGVKIDLPDDATPLLVFSKIFTEELWLRLVTETNLYAEQSRNETPSSSKWTPVTMTEMKTFIGLCVAMGILQLPARRDYWRQKKWLFQTNFPEAMARDRFAMIWRYLHLQDNQANDVDRSDKLWKLRWFLNYLTSQFQSLYEVNGYVTVDESMVKFKGRLAFCQYLPLKPTKWGVKVWVMAESSTGYITNFQVYTGREGTGEKGLAHRVVMDLATPYYGSHLSIFMDNFYSGVELFEEMKGHGLDACGTVRANRKGLPKDKMLTKQATLDKHKFRVAQKNDLTLCVWQDTKVVMVLSNYHDPTEKGSVRRRRQGGTQTAVVVPACLSDYQKYMKGVDLLDQMIGYYQFQHRSKKWWRRLFFFFLAAGCYNAYVAARCAGGNTFKYKSGYKDWLEDLAQELVTPVTARSAPQCSSGPVGATSEHDCEKIFEKRKVCRECALSRSGTDVRARATVYGCRQCNEALHVECFGKHVRRHHK
ncbi:hypothetical protein AAFF_G00315840 [Aldrovandia affinis]|uniref:PiggyBac transposable element-derived protein domain-containing protein n=1 Tax=Aldrovandia affinis TaxID=143900 RepID=A0AAD7SN67_9TELE|nr:hypothetical protein AAFF_G00315840 [Aldrovandia affinis]